MADNEGFYLGTKPPSPTFYGFGYLNQFQNRPVVTADVAFVRGPDPYNYTPPYVWRSPEQTATVAGYFIGPLYQGDVACMTGATTPVESCGEVNYTDESGRSLNGAFYYSGGTCATYSSDAGDSGAPVYQSDFFRSYAVTAAGMHYASHFKDGNRDAGCFVDISKIQEQTGVELANEVPAEDIPN